jgi:hypothetical protein
MATPMILDYAPGGGIRAQIYHSLTVLGDQEGSLISQQDGSHGSQPGKPHSRARLRVLERR